MLVSRVGQTWDDGLNLWLVVKSELCSEYAIHTALDLRRGKMYELSEHRRAPWKDSGEGLMVIRWRRVA